MSEAQWIKDLRRMQEVEVRDCFGCGQGTSFATGALLIDEEVYCPTCVEDIPRERVAR